MHVRWHYRDTGWHGYMVVTKMVICSSLRLESVGRRDSRWDGGINIFALEGLFFAIVIVVVIFYDSVACIAVH